MSLHLYYTVAGVKQKLDPWLDWTSVKITEQINMPTSLTFSLTNTGGFPGLVQRAYVELYSTRWERNLFTGFIATTPAQTAIGTGGTSSLPSRREFRFDVTCQSDDYLLNIKAVQFIPAFINQTQGEILTTIAETLCPGYFNTQFIASGDIVPSYQYDPTQTWAEVAKTFGDGTRMRYKVRDKEIYYQPYGDGDLGINYDEELGEGYFDPYGMQTTVLQVPIVNDVTIIGDVEAGNNREDYFIGDGFTGNYPLRHKVFEGASTLLLNDDWTEQAFDVQQWNVQDPAGQMNIGAGALNLISTFAFPLGQSYLQLNNGIELAGGIDVEHGEFGFNNISQGIVGGLYLDSTMSLTGCLCGFYISTPQGVTLGASGAAGVLMQPTYNNVAVGTGITSVQNHTYVLRTLVSAAQYAPYQMQYRSLEGPVFGGQADWVAGSLTFYIEDTDIAAATGFYYQPNITKYTVNNINLPPFCVYGLLNNQQLNCTINYTTIAQMPLGTLQAWEGPQGFMYPSGIALPLLPAWAAGYLGPVKPWPAGGSGAILPPPLPRADTPTQERMGQEDFIFQAAQITQGNESDTLAFFAQTLPTAGTPIRLQTWESQAAISRMQATGSIATEAAVVGDDGLRSAIVNNLSPLPRTSEDCDNAAAAFLLDRVNTYWNGSYTCTSYFFTQDSSDVTFWPTCGRFLWINAPDRGIVRQKMLVTGVTITVGDAVGNNQQTLTRPVNQVGEVLVFNLSFGADLHLEKVLANFVAKPTNILQPSDTAVPLNPQNSYQIDNTFLPDVQATVSYPIFDTSFGVLVYDSTGLPLEVRLSDTQWGNGATANYVGTFPTPVPAHIGLRTGFFGGSPGPVNPPLGPSKVITVNGSNFSYPSTFNLTRQQLDQTWYMRYVQNGQFSRRSKVLRVVYPLQPAAPTVDSADTNFVQFDFGGGDIRSVFGFELRSSDNKTIIIQKPVYSVGDLLLDLTQTKATAPFTPPDQNSFTNGNGIVAMTSYAAGKAAQGGLRFGNFIFETSALPADAVISAIYPVLDMDYFKDTGFAAAAVGYGGPIPNPAAPSMGGTPMGNFAGSFQRMLVVGPNVGTNFFFLNGSMIAVQIRQNGTDASMADLLDVYGVGMAVYYNSATPLVDQQMPAPFPPGAQGLAWAIPTTLQQYTGPNMTVSGTSAKIGTNQPSRTYNGYFFNHQWSYSPPTQLILPKPSPPVLSEGYRFGQALNVLSSTLPRNDITAQRFQVSTDPQFDAAGVILDITNNFQAGSTSFNVPVSADLYVRSVFSDFISSGNWSSPLHVPVGNLLASDYLSAQGSAPPSITNIAGALVTYNSNIDLIVVNVAGFTLQYPNGGTYNVPGVAAPFNITKDTAQHLLPGSGYLFYISCSSPALPNAAISIDGPYQNPSNSALNFTTADGRVPLENGSLTFFTSTTPTGTAGGGSGGSFGGGQYCGVKKSKIKMADGTWKSLGDLRVGDIVDDSYGGQERVMSVEYQDEVEVRTVYLATGKRTRCGLAHTFEVNYGWEPLCDIISDFKVKGIYPMIATSHGLERIMAVDDPGNETVVLIKLEGPNHTYFLDGIRTHNVLYKD